MGLDDREIPPEKLTKLEKIGSGGFKDVFIGRYKGRKIAIAEFRGQLNESRFEYLIEFLPKLNIAIVDINELKLLGGFNHPNIVRFVRTVSSFLVEEIHCFLRLESAFPRILVTHQS